jgi:hypothetical protein
MESRSDSELDELIELISKHYGEPKPWLAEGAAFRVFVPMWDGTFPSERSEVEAEGGSLATTLRELAGRFGLKPSLDFAWGALAGRPPDRFPLPLEPVMDEVKDRCDAGELLIAVSRAGAPRVCRLAAFPEVYEVTIERADGQREVRPWSDWAAGLEAFVSLR